MIILLTGLRLVSLGKTVIFCQNFRQKSNSVEAKHQEKVTELEGQLAVGREERNRLKESSDVVVKCVRALQSKLQNETQIREQFVETSTLEKASQNKKLDT